MSEVGIRDAISFRIVRQILDHVYGSEQEMTDRDFVRLSRTFQSLGGRWEFVVRGDPGSFASLMDVIKAFVKVKKTLAG
jgi:hypothetical protein